MLHVAVPVQAPDQPAKALLVPGVSLSVTCVFWLKLAEQVVGQLIPAGVLVTVPAPAPAIVTLTWNDAGGCVLDPGAPPQLDRRRLDRRDRDEDINNQNEARHPMAQYSPADGTWMMLPGPRLFCPASISATLGA